MHTPIEALATAVIEAMNSRQLETIRDLVTDDFVDHGSPVPLPPGPDGYIAILTFVTTVLQVRYEVHDVVAGDRHRRDPRHGPRRQRGGTAGHRAHRPAVRDEDGPLLPFP